MFVDSFYVMTSLAHQGRDGDSRVKPTLKGPRLYMSAYSSCFQPFSFRNKLMTPFQKLYLKKTLVLESITSTKTIKTVFFLKSFSFILFVFVTLRKDKRF